MTKRVILFICCLLAVSFYGQAQVGIGTISPDNTSALDITSTQGGLLMPRMTMAERDVLGSPGVPATGLIIYQTDNVPGFYYYDGTRWLPFGVGPRLLPVYDMAIPICNGSTVNDTNWFPVYVDGVYTVVTWTILDKKDVTGQTVVINGEQLLRTPFFPSQLQVSFDFNPPLPFNPRGIFFSGNNTRVPFPIPEQLNSFRFDYITKSASSIVINIGRTDRFGDTTAPCWAGIFYFDMLLAEN